MELKETPQLLSRLNEIVERSRFRRDKKLAPASRKRPRETLPAHRGGLSLWYKRNIGGS